MIIIICFFPASIQTPSYEQELEYAYRRRNVLEAFIDSAAQAVMRKFSMNTDDTFMINQDDLVQEIKLDDIDLSSQNGHTKTIKIDPSQIKITRKKDKTKIKHDEM